MQVVVKRTGALLDRDLREETVGTKSIFQMSVANELHRYISYRLGRLGTYERYRRKNRRETISTNGVS